jgi:hypothetical protein
MRRATLLALVFAIGTASGWILSTTSSRHRHPHPAPPAARVPEYITIGRPEPASPSGRAWHTLRVVPPAPLKPDEKLTDQWVVTLLTDDIEEGGGVRSVSYTAK